MDFPQDPEIMVPPNLSLDLLLFKRFLYSLCLRCSTIHGWKNPVSTLPTGLIFDAEKPNLKDSWYANGPKVKRNQFFQLSSSKHTKKNIILPLPGFFFRKKYNYYGIVRVLLLFLLLHPIHFFTPCFACALLRRVWGTPKFSISEDLQMCDLADFGIRDSHPWGSNYITPTQALCTNLWANHSKITIDLHTFFDSSNS